MYVLVYTSVCVDTHTHTYVRACVRVCVTRPERKNRLGVKRRLKNFLKISLLHHIDTYITILLYTVAIN